MSKMNQKEEKDGNATLEAIYGKIENIKIKEEVDTESTKKSQQVGEETKEEEESEDDTESTEIAYKNKLKKHKNFEKRGQKFNKSKNRASGNKRYETYSNDY